MLIKVIKSYSRMTWYSKRIGEIFEVAEISGGDVRVKNENVINSMWIYDGDFEVLK